MGCNQMISRADFTAYSRDVSALTESAANETRRQISLWMNANPEASIAEIRSFANDTMAGLSQVYGEAAATLAANWYDEQASLAHVKLPSAITEVTYDAEQIKKVAHYQATKLTQGDTDGFLDACSEYMENSVKQSLNDTIMANAKRDKDKGVRFARVTTGAETCAFCYMLSSRGAVYHSRQTAGEFNHYHRRCDCKVVPGFEADPYAEIVEGYDPKGMQSRMALIEEQTGLTFGKATDASALSREMKLRDSQWLLDGTLPNPSYFDGKAKQKKLADKNHSAEKKTGEILSKSGYSTVFVDDELKYIDEETGLEQTIGLPDLSTGLEIKNVQTASSENTISKHLSNAKKKKGFTQVVIDVSENANLSDSEAKEYIRNGLKRHRIENALMINHNKEIETVWAKKRVTCR